MYVCAKEIAYCIRFMCIIMDSKVIFFRQDINLQITSIFDVFDPNIHYGITTALLNLVFLFIFDGWIPNTEYIPVCKLCKSLSCCSKFIFICFSLYLILFWILNRLYCSFVNEVRLLKQTENPHKCDAHTNQIFQLK